MAIFRILLGTVTVWSAVRLLPQHYPFLIAWTGMVGLVLIMHFGIFDVLSLAWRRAGANARPLMRAPLTARSLSEFWRSRWNTAFSELTERHLFIGLSKRFGPKGALLASFVASGLVHELVISVPARGGYGLPTLYFILQSIGVLFERSPSGRKLALGSGWKGWSYVALVAGLPAYWLFHPVFIHTVILPMLHAIGAT